MSTKHHISTSIQGLLNQSDKVLIRMFQMPAADIRSELEQRLAKGEKFIPSEGCEGFDATKGCPGHPVSPISLLKEGVPDEGGEGREKSPYQLPTIITNKQNLLT